MQDFFKEQTSKLLTYVAPGGHTRVAEVRGLGGGVAQDVAYGDLLAGVHVLQVPHCQGNSLHLQYNEQIAREGKKEELGPGVS